MSNTEEVNRDINISPFGVKFGVIASLSVIIYSMILNITGLNTSQSLGMISYILIGGIMYVACKNYKEANQGYISFGGGFGLSMMIAAISGAISSVFTYVYMVFVDSSILELIKEKQLEEFEKQGLTDAQIEQALDMASTFMTPGFISSMAFVGILLIGAIIGLIVAGIVKNSRPLFD